MKSKKLLITIITIITIIFILFVIILLLSNDEYSQNETLEYIEDAVSLSNSIESEKDRDKFFMVEYFVNSYITTNNSEVALALLDDEYVESNKITENNIIKYKKRYDENINVITNKLDKIDWDYNKNLYIYNGTIFSSEYKTIQDIDIILKVDYIEKTYSIIPDKNFYDEYINNKEQVDLKEKIGNITNKTYNVFEYTTTGNEYMARKYFNMYKQYMIYNPELAYTLLEEEYKQKRFGTLENFLAYVNEYKTDIISIELIEYKVMNKEDYTEYIGKDNVGNYYIFKEKEIMQYTVQLDSYTIESENFKSTYNEANTQNRVMLNIDKYIKMLNNRDYKNAYNLLDLTFRNNNYPTEQQFKNFCNEKLPSKYEVSFIEFIEQANVSMQKIELKDIVNRGNKINMTIIIKLEEDNTNFIMSFTI